VLSLAQFTVVDFILT